MTLIDDYLGYEDFLGYRFPEQPVLWSLDHISNEQFTYFLLQASRISFNFVPWMIQGMLGMRDEQLRMTPRNILLEEMGLEEDAALPPYARKAGAMHMELLLKDLQGLGLSREKVLSTRPSGQTKATIEGLNGLIPSYTDPDYDVKMITAFRTGGERFVGALYEVIVRQLRRRYGPEAGKYFYVPHYEHDHVGSELCTHTDGYLQGLHKLITNEHTLEVAKATVLRAYEVRATFLKQFTPWYFDHLNEKVAQFLAVTKEDAGSVNTEKECQLFLMLIEELDASVEDFLASPHHKDMEGVASWRNAEEYLDGLRQRKIFFEKAADELVNTVKSHMIH